MKTYRDRHPDEKIFERIPVRADIHSYRRKYAKERYRELTGREYEKIF
ncbi:hypothetical protein L7E55_05600 [Pelotomaculum isophthalicicum JI]|uniref:Uncharacterized protein n=1 Tax=Pelotomaculum isophthalicicum JI TaxID=947010 RepID=A0A9X4GYJ5_9FIRM|nr:hypothetical protein [Pelotomaculum isophthalicicum]MDF9407837.1 hypothetical protein [Pelotomaculum isophthalicicum JI]